MEIKEQYEAFVEKWKLQGGTEFGRAVFDCSEELESELQELMRAVAEKQREKDADRAWSYGVQYFMQGIGAREAVENVPLITNQLKQE